MILMTIIAPQPHAPILELVASRESPWRRCEPCPTLARPLLGRREKEYYELGNVVPNRLLAIVMSQRDSERQIRRCDFDHDDDDVCRCLYPGSNLVKVEQPHSIL